MRSVGYNSRSVCLCVCVCVSTTILGLYTGYEAAY